jgi:DNA methylase/Helicase conserved C-terminal domain
MTYKDFLAGKRKLFKSSGIEPKAVHESLFDFQGAIVRWALRKGRAAIFADCGLGKTRMQLEWARQIATSSGNPVLILAPIAVSEQTIAEGKEIGLGVKHIKDDKDRDSSAIFISNYEKLHKFDCSAFSGVVLDESSILKSFDGAMRNQLVEAFERTPYKLCCTATPAPNDHMELGNHAEFLGVLTRTEMLSTYFVHDGGDTAKWRLKGHAEDDFWHWMCSWSVMIRKPSDIGFSDDGFDLPPLTIKHVTVESDQTDPDNLFALPASSLSERRVARRESLSQRVTETASICDTTEQCLVWCNLNDESVDCSEAIDEALEVTGSDKDEYKASTMLAFAAGNVRVLVSKPSICGFGMNFQSCHNVIFCGLSDSYEQFYQAVRRCWRFGQKQEVNVFVITSSLEQAVVENIERKQADADKMLAEMIKRMKNTMQEELGNTRVETKEESTNGECIVEKNWTMMKGDCVESIQKIRSDSVHYSVFSPPFASLYTYTASDRDMGNCADHSEFFKHLQFLTVELFRVIMPGRLLSFHCMNLPTSKERDGYIGITDFRGELIRVFRESGFIYHSEVVIWKDPVTAMQRTKALGLLHKQIKKDSCMSRQGIPDYLVTMRKPGDNPERVTHTNESFPVDLWQRYASPIWMDINPSNTLQRESAREHKDERHICPLQLQVIQRAIELWTNPGDLVLDPFSGIGSTGYQALKMGRKYLGIELKSSYFKQSCLNLKAATADTLPLFDEPAFSLCA